MRGLLGSAAALVAVGMGSAQAADLPVKAKSVEYVKICSLYGAGFYYIPGTDTCIRVYGHIRSEASFNSRGTNTPTINIGDGLATRTRDRDYFITRSRAYLSTDTRTQTSFGTLRTFSHVRFEHITPVGLTAASTVVGLETAIIQWGGFTIGRAATSYMDNPWTYAAKWGPNGWFGNPDTAGTGRFVVAYTHSFGNSLTGTLALEDGKERRRGNYNGANALAAWGVNPPTLDTRGGNTWPEIVGQLRMEQSWGGFQVAGNLVSNHVAYNCGGTPAAGCTELSGHPSDKVGGSINAALRINVPTGVNDAIYFGGGYSLGALTNSFGGRGPGIGIYGGSNIAYGSITGTHLFESVYSTTARTGAGRVVAPTGQQLTSGYGGSVQFEHGWNAEWRSSIFGGAEFVDYNGTANAILCSRFNGAAGSAGTLSNFNTSCNMDLRIAGVGSRTFWTPVRDLTIGVEVTWTNVHSENNGALLLQPAIQGFKPPAVYEVRDQNILSGTFSVRRFF